ncbi:MAG: hypothetical protein A2506_12090 [Elusimicrobia bacterium RIFOXYD12_FULL_66_9]|nr:MAG: hypothetical protein A2506_12090 [Elusimicrobia bacterium RIFOXYD12_FULL_66_9]
MPTRLLAASVRACVARRDLPVLARAVRAAGPETLVSAWPSLSPLERLAAFKTLPPRGARAAFLGLDDDGRWLAYLGAPHTSVAPLLEGAPRRSHHLLRAPGAAELRAMRRTLAR